MLFRWILFSILFPFILLWFKTTYDMTMRKNSNHRNIIKNMILLRKDNTIIASLKYLKKPTEKIISPLILKVGSMQMRVFFSRNGSNF